MCNFQLKCVNFMLKFRMASSGASNAAEGIPLKRNSGDPAWEYAECRDPTNLNFVWCTLCGKRMSGGIYRVKEHLMHKKGNVSGCPKVTLEITKKISDSMSEKGNKRMEKIRITNLIERRNEDMDEGEEEQHILSGCGGSGSDPTVQHPSSSIGTSKKRKSITNVKGPLDNMFKPDYEKAKQARLDQNNPYKEKKKKEAWLAIAEWAYEVGLPFNAVRVDSFQTMVYKIGEYGPCKFISFLLLS